MRFLKRKPSYTRTQIKKARPIRNPDLQYVEQENGEVTLQVPAEKSRGITKLIAKTGHGPAFKEVELEPVGGFVWKNCDGKQTVEGIAERLRKEFKLEKLEAEASLLAFLETLSRRRFILLEVPKK